MIETRFENPEQMLKLKCDVHAWEFAYITVVEHPFFAVTDRNGNFVIPNVPPGKYTIEAVHRKAGKATKQISVEGHRDTSVRFVLEAKESPRPQRFETAAF